MSQNLRRLRKLDSSSSHLLNQSRDTGRHSRQENNDIRIVDNDVLFENDLSNSIDEQQGWFSKDEYERNSPNLYHEFNFNQNISLRSLNIDHNQTIADDGNEKLLSEFAVELRRSQAINHINNKAMLSLLVLLKKNLHLLVICFY